MHIGAFLLDYFLKKKIKIKKVINMYT